MAFEANNTGPSSPHSAPEPLLGTIGQCAAFWHTLFARPSGPGRNSSSLTPSELSLSNLVNLNASSMPFTSTILGLPQRPSRTIHPLLFPSADATLVLQKEMLAVSFQGWLNPLRRAAHHPMRGFMPRLKLPRHGLAHRCWAVTYRGFGRICTAIRAHSCYNGTASADDSVSNKDATMQSGSWWQ